MMVFRIASYAAVALAGTLALSAQNVPIVRQVDHVLFRAANGAEGRKLTSLLVEVLGLPLVFPSPGEAWTTSAGVGFGNCTLEILYSGREESTAAVTSLALEPAAGIDTSLTELRARKIDHFPPSRYPETTDLPLRWTTIGLRGFGHGMFLIQYIDMNERRDRFARALSDKNGGALGVVHMREVAIAHQNRTEFRRQWTALLGPAMPGDIDVWNLSSGPQLRLVDPAGSRAGRFLIVVRSLREAAAALESRQIPFDNVDGELWIDPAALFGLRLSLRD